jgi:hypothetical protein
MQEALRRVTGQAISVRVEIDTSAAAKAVVNVSPATAAPAAIDRKKTLGALPLFKKASEVLGAQIWHMDDDFNPAAPPRTTQRPNKDHDPDADTEEG